MVLLTKQNNLNPKNGSNAGVALKSISNAVVAKSINPNGFVSKSLNDLNPTLFASKSIPDLKNDLNPNPINVFVAKSRNDLSKDSNPTLFASKSTNDLNKLLFADLSTNVSLRDTNGVSLMKQNSWSTFFYDWYNESKENDLSTLTHLIKLTKENEMLSKKIDYLQEVVLSLQKKPRVKRTKRILRDTLNRAEFESILEKDVDSRSDLSLSRKRLSLILLYITGLRVSNLLSLRVQDLKDLLLKKEMTISLIKRGSNCHRILLSDSHHKLLEKYSDGIAVLIKNKAYDDLIFSSLKNANKPYQRAEFTRVLNKILKKASSRLMKNLKTHSFRTTFITQLLVNNPVEKIYRIVGHKSILSTLVYDRNVLKRKDHRFIVTQSVKE